MSEHSHLQYGDIDPVALDTELGMERYRGGGDLDPKLVLLVKIRASELNGCSYCRAMHAEQALALGEQPRRVEMVADWADAPDIYSVREQAALTFTESLTTRGESAVPKEVWRDASLAFDEREVVDLLIVISSINGWNLLKSSTQTPTNLPIPVVCEPTS